jgi:hypothetical protein
VKDAVWNQSSNMPRARGRSSLPHAKLQLATITLQLQRLNTMTKDRHAAESTIDKSTCCITAYVIAMTLQQRKQTASDSIHSPIVHFGPVPESSTSGLHNQPPKVGWLQLLFARRKI